MSLDRRLLRLKHDQISTAVFEMRFEPKVQGAADLFPGILFGKLQDIFSQTASAPMSQVPLAVLQQMPDWEFTPVKQLVGLGVNLNIAQKSIAVECFRPYPGWSTFRRYVHKVIDALAESQLIATVTRYSVRYSNVISKDFLSGLDELNLVFKIDGYNLSAQGFQTRFQIERDDYLAIIQLATDAQTSGISGGKAYAMSGTLVDVDVIAMRGADNFFNDYETRIDALHDAEKAIFFDLLKDSAIEKLGAEWEEAKAK